MAVLELNSPTSLRWSSSEGLLTWSDWLVGYTDGRFAMVRYKFEITTPLVRLALKFTDKPNSLIFSHYGGKDYRGVGSNSGFGFYISKTNHSIPEGLTKNALGLPGMTEELSSSLGFTGTDYKEIVGELDLSDEPLPAGTYYLYIHNRTKTYGCMRWSARVSDNNYIPPYSECTYESYTAPTAPVNFAFTYPVEKKRFLLSTGFTVTWKEATAGINNPITGYELFLNESSLGTIKKTGQSTYSYTHKFLDDFQGKDISVSIRTIATEEIAKYSEKESIVGRVNTRPSIPNIFKNYSGNGVYISGNITLTLEGQDFEDGAEELAYWRKSDTGDWKKVDNGIFSSLITQTSTYYFKTEDSIGEYSEVKEFIVNCYPELTINEVNSTRYNGKTEYLNLEVNGKCKAKTTVGKNLILSKGISSINCVDTFGLGKNVTITFYPLDSDGIELGMGINATKSLTIDTPELPSPKNVEVYDSWEGENIINSSDYPCFFKRIRLKIPRFDSRVEDKPIQIIFDEKPVSASRIIDGDYFYLNGEFDIAASTTKKPLSIKLSQYDEISLGDYNRVIEFPFENLKGNYTNTPVIYQNNIAVEFARNPDNDLLKVYGLSNPIFTMDIICQTGNVYGLTTTLTESEKSSYICTYSLSEGLPSELNIDATDYLGKKLFLLTMHVKNKYGHISTKYCEQEYDFEKPAEISGISLKYQKNSNNEKIWASPSSADSFKYIEGMPIKISYTIKRWSATPTGIEIRANKSGELLKFFEDNHSNSFEGTETSTSHEFNLSKITGSSSLWNLYLNGQSCLGQSFGTLPINDKIVTLGGFWYNDGLYTLQSDYSINREDKDTTLAHYLFIDEKEYKLSKDDESELLKFSFKSDQESRPDPMSNQDSLIGQLRIKETASAADYSITKEWNSNTVVIYNIVPTISYRKNRVGINTSELDSEGLGNSVLYVARAGNGDQIVFNVTDESGNSGNITINLKNGNITGTGGQLSGFSFSIDCGSW